MKVIFNHPPIGKNNPLWYFDPANAAHYPNPNTNGVYIYGLRLMVNGEYKFVPTVVGEGNLLSRLYKDHYLGKFKNPLSNLTCNSNLRIGDKKELWNFSNFICTHLDLQLKYNQMLNYDTTIKNKFTLAHFWNELVYFQDFRFYEYLISHQTSVKRDLNIVEAVEDLKTKLYGNLAMEYIWKIKATLSNFNSHFYFVYADLYDKYHIILDDPDVNSKYFEWDNPKKYDKSSNGKKITKVIENTVKEALNKINISTTADSSKGVLPLQIDLSLIQNELVNVGGHNYGFPDYDKVLKI
jgi:hypothetical protein